MVATVTNWRLINDEFRSGPENMAVDEALLRSFDPATSLPTLRLYGWQPAALSLGRFQKGGEALDLERCRRANLPVVRRMTGGGAIYHADEVTYAIVCSPEQIPPASSIKDSFRILTGFLIELYRDLGLEPAFAVDTLSRDTRFGERSAFCFAGKESFDIIVNGKKIGGNAQRRTRGVIFQHGSLPLLNRAATGLAFMKERTPELAEDSISLEQCGVPADYRMLRQRVLDAFQRYFVAQLLPGAVTERERSLADELLKRRYGVEQWNLDGEEA